LRYRKEASVGVEPVDELLKDFALACVTGNGKLADRLRARIMEHVSTPALECPHCRLHFEVSSPLRPDLEFEATTAGYAPNGRDPNRYSGRMECPRGHLYHARFVGDGAPRVITG
jgi:hypothetical protein